MKTNPNPSTFAELPALGAPLEAGKFAGVSTQADGTHVAVVLLPDQASDIEWANATEWAAQLGGVLPTRPIAAMLFANVKSLLRPKWHWTSDEDRASYAWVCYFLDGLQLVDHESFEGSAVAVRLIPLIPEFFNPFQQPGNPMTTELTTIQLPALAIELQPCTS